MRQVSAAARKRWNPFDYAEPTHEQLFDVSLSAMEAAILLAAEWEACAMLPEHYRAFARAARRLHNLHLVHLGRLDDGCRIVMRTELGEAFVERRQNELSSLAAGAPEIGEPWDDAKIVWEEDASAFYPELQARRARGIKTGPDPISGAGIVTTALVRDSPRTGRRYLHRMRALRKQYDEGIVQFLADRKDRAAMVVHYAELAEEQKALKTMPSIMKRRRSR